MSKYKRYERYKDSGVEWIGDIPEHWELRRIKFIGTLYSGNGFKEELQGKEEGDYPFYKVSDINGDGKLVTFSNNYVDKDDIVNNRWNIIPQNSILFAKIGEALKKNHRKINAYSCLIDNNIAALKPHEIVLDYNYFYYYFSCINAEWFVNPGTLPSINNTYLKNFIALLPSKNEQKIIANFLDQKTAEIDGLIADKEKLIELLQEKRQAIITEAVTKGLNPNVRMKDSGIEWIGEIPEHWEIVPLKHITNFISRGNSPEYLEESSIKVINQACIYWDELKIENVKYQNDDIEFDKLKGKLIKGDLLLNSTGTGTLGRAVVFREDGKYMADSHVTIIRFNKTRMNEVLAFYLLQTKIYQGYIYNALVTGATNQIELSRERLTGTPMIVPPSIEQQEIVNFLNSKIGQIAILINEIKTQIQKLEEYRQSLISEAVTGKIDVRDYVVSN